MKKKKCAILDDEQQVALGMAHWDSLSREVEVTSFASHVSNEEELIEAISDYDIVVAMRERTAFPASVLKRLPRLKLLVTTGMRNASIDVAAAAACGITVCGTASQPNPPVELTWALILALTRNIVHEHASLRSCGPWQSSLGIDLYGKQLGILGLGKIGSRVARIGQAFGMNVAAFSHHLTQERANAIGVTWVPSKEELLGSSDIVSIHLVLSDRTRGLIGASDLQKMRSSAYLINTSRAAIIDENALLQALEHGWIAGAGIDVFETEPLPQEHPFRSAPRLLATPHLGYVTDGNYRLYYREVVEGIRAFLDGAPIRCVSSESRR